MIRITAFTQLWDSAGSAGQNGRDAVVPVTLFRVNVG